MSATDAVNDICGYTARQHAAHVIVIAVAAGTVGAVVTNLVAKRRAKEQFTEAYDIGYDEGYKRSAHDQAEQLAILRKEGYASTPESARAHLIGDDEVVQPDPADEPTFVADPDEPGDPRQDPNYIPDPDATTSIWDIDATELEKQMMAGEDDDVEVYEPDPEWDWTEELAARNTSKPYVIHLEEFLQNEHDFTQLSISYYEGDMVLTDESDFPFMAIEEIVGSENLKRFGDGSGDKHTVFVRNEQLGIDYEITRSEGSFQNEVAGFTPDELDDAATHEQMRRNRRRNGREET